MLVAWGPGLWEVLGRLVPHWVHTLQLYTTFTERGERLERGYISEKEASVSG